MSLKDDLVKSEGFERKLYKCPAGKWTIGVGWNIEDNGLPDEIIWRLLEIGMENAAAMLDKRIPWWRKLDPARQQVLHDMAYNMGPKLFTFVVTLAAVKRGDYVKAAQGMKASLWARQVGDRAVRLARIMETGHDGAGGT